MAEIETTGSTFTTVRLRMLWSCPPSPWAGRERPAIPRGRLLASRCAFSQGSRHRGARRCRCCRAADPKPASGSVAERDFPRSSAIPAASLAGTVKLTKSSSIDPQDTGLEPAVNPPCWGSETAVSLNLTIPGRRQWPAATVCGHRWPVYGSQPPPRSRGPGHRARRPASRALLGERSADNDVCEPAHLIPSITSMAASRRRVGTEQARLV